MNRAVFRYRSPGFFVLAGFLTVWSAGWIYGITASIRKSLSVPADESVTNFQELPLYYFMLAIGILVACAAVATWLYVANARVEIEDDFLHIYSLFGVRVVKGSLASARVSQKSDPLIIETDGGSFKVNRYLSNYGLFRSMMEHHSLDQAVIATSPVREPLVVPITEYNYRWTYQHVMSMVMLCAGLAMAAFIFTTNPKGGWTVGSIAPIAAFFGLWVGLLGSIAIFCWNGKVTVETQGVTLYNWLGHEKSKIAPETIVEVKVVVSRQGNGLGVYTTAGTFNIFAGIRNCGELRAQIQSFIDYYQARTAATVEPKRQPDLP